MKYYFCIIFLTISTLGYAQEIQTNIHFLPSINGQSIELGKGYYLAELEDSLSFDRIKFYISDISFLQRGKEVASLEKKHFLLDLEKPESLHIAAGQLTSSFDQISFNLGIDSLTSVSGAFGGDLDPTNGMYWSWQSGYINLKLEGKANKCPGRKNKFQFHIGGYQHPCNTLQKISLEVPEVEVIEVHLNLNEFFAQVDLQKSYQVMSPNAEALELAQKISKIFHVRYEK